MVFNQAIELDARATANFYAEQIDDAFTVTTFDSDADGVTNTFHLDESEQAQEKGTSFRIAGNVLTFTWRSVVAFSTTDPDDAILAVQWNALDQLVVRPVGADGDSATSVAALLGTSSVAVQLVASP